MNTFVCINCNKTYQLAKTKRRSGYMRQFCSGECQQEYRRKNSVKVKFTCAVCQSEFLRTPKEIKKSKSGLCFCSSSCAASYNNTHKEYGTRRSKLEAYIEQQLRLDFPALELVCNGKDAIGSELDFYFPQLRLAIELNGIFHYEPIYGTGKLERIQANDQQKYIACTNAGIELCIIDTSSVINTTKAAKAKYYSIVKDLVVRLVGRAGDADVQAP